MNRVALSRLWVLGIVGILSLASSARATQQLLTAGQAGGWSATAPDGDNVGLQVLGIVNDTLYIKKHAVFSGGAEVISPITIDFTTDGQTGIKRIIIDAEEVGNDTTQDITGLHFLLSGATFDPTAALTFNTDPFLNRQLTQQNHELVMTGGVLKAGQSFFPGFGKNGGELAIQADGAFTLIEVPGGPGDEPLVALPSAIWTGASALGVLGFIRGAKKLRARLG